MGILICANETTSLFPRGYYVENTFTTFKIIFPNHTANVNQSLAETGFVYSNEWLHPFSMEDSSEIARIQCLHLTVFPRTTWPISTKEYKNLFS